MKTLKKKISQCDIKYVYFKMYTGLSTSKVTQFPSKWIKIIIIQLFKGQLFNLKV